MGTVADALRGLRIGANEIAEKSQLSLGRVQEILAGEGASLSELRAISAGLRLPLHTLAEGRRAVEPGSKLEPLFRDTAKASAEFDVTVEKVATFVEAALEILPSRTELPHWLQALKPGAVSYVEADRLATHCRQLLYPGREDEPATDLPTILGRQEGVVVSRLLFSRYEGVSLIAGNYCFVFVSPRFPGRMLFTLGHELGHIVAHHRKSRTALFERPSEIASFGHSSRREAFVDAFSSCFLLPDVGVGKALRSFRTYYEIASKSLTDFEILLLARFYGVSFEVAARRCEDLEMLPKGVGYAIAAKLKKEYGSPEKRAVELGVPPRVPVNVAAVSGSLAKAIASKITVGNVSLGWATDRFGLSIGEVLSAHAKVETP
ncbi:MAG TPA: ImmA/IrrE family metallo-endopeptidase [Allosphingosinicella sp.]